MENVSLKLESSFVNALEKAMKKNRYMTKAEFIREALRDKIKELEKEELLQRVEKLFGSSKHKTTGEDLERAREEAAKELEKKFGFV